MGRFDASKNVGILRSSRQQLAWAAGLALVGGASAASMCSAATIADYTIAGPVASQTQATNVAAGVTASGFGTAFNWGATDSGYSGGTGGGSAFIKDLNNNGANGNVPESESGATAAGAYWSFTLTPTAGNSLHGLTLTFEYGDLFQSNDIDSQSFVIQSSAAGFGTDLFSATVPYVSSSATAVFTPSSSIDLTGGNGDQSGPVTVRIYEYFTPGSGAQNTSAQDNQYINDFAITGSVVSATPEPASLAIMGLAGLGLLGRRRRRTSVSRG